MIGARQHLPRVPEEQLEQRELGASELDGQVASAYLTRPEMELEIREAEHVRRVVAVRRPSEQRAKSCKQLRKRERLREVVVGSRIEPGDAVVDLCTRGQHQHRNGIPTGTKSSAHLETVDSWHEDVEDDGVSLRGATETFERRLAVSGELDLVPLEVEGTLQRLADSAFVIDDQDLHGPHCALRRESELGS